MRKKEAEQDAAKTALRHLQKTKARRPQAGQDPELAELCLKRCKLKCKEVRAEGYLKPFRVALGRLLLNDVLLLVGSMLFMVRELSCISAGWCRLGAPACRQIVDSIRGLPIHPPSNQVPSNPTWNSV